MICLISSAVHPPFFARVWPRFQAAPLNDEVYLEINEVTSPPPSDPHRTFSLSFSALTISKPEVSVSHGENAPPGFSWNSDRILSSSLFLYDAHPRCPPLFHFPPLFQ